MWTPDKKDKDYITTIKHKYVINIIYFYSLTRYKSWSVDRRQTKRAAAIFDVAGIRIAGHDGDLVEFVSSCTAVGTAVGAVTVAPNTRPDQPASRRRRVVRLFPTPQTQHQSLSSGHQHQQQVLSSS